MYPRICRSVLSLILVAALFTIGCDKVKEFAASSGLQKSGGKQKEVPSLTGMRDEDSIVIASFNIQVFGQSKLKKPDAMDVLAKVVRNFDIVAIQEIRSKEDDVMPRFVDLINQDGHRYDFVVGERLGRTSSKEQYAFVYDTTRIEVIPGSAYTVPDPRDHLHREPLACSFRTRGVSSGQPFSFTLVNIHTDPDETDQELDALDDAFLYVRHKTPSEDDVILLGDLNVDANHLGQLGQLPNIAWVIDAKTTTNTRQSKSYDNIVFDRTTTTEYQNSGGVMNLMSEFQLTEEAALKVSDHMPVWAAFSIHEGGTPRVARQP